MALQKINCDMTDFYLFSDPGKEQKETKSEQ